MPASTDSGIHAWLLERLVCPRDKQSLTPRDDRLICPSGHVYPVVSGVPVMLIPEVIQTMDLAEVSLRLAENPPDPDGLYVASLGLSDEEKRGIIDLAQSGGASIDPAVAFLVGATCGLAYKTLIGAIREYPIPELRLPPGSGQALLDIGCNWGRWSVAAARLGYRPIGIDPSLGSVMAAQRVARTLGVEAAFVVGDARYLPFASSNLDRVFSYSVLQHLSPRDVDLAVEEIRRVLKPGGTSLIQMPTRLGLRCLYHQARRGFREARAFEVRYWSFADLNRVFTRIGSTRFSVDCFFGIGLQWSDRRLMPPSIRPALLASEGLRRLSMVMPSLARVADSVYVSSTKP